MQSTRTSRLLMAGMPPGDTRGATRLAFFTHLTTVLFAVGRTGGVHIHGPCTCQRAEEQQNKQHQHTGFHHISRKLLGLIDCKTQSQIDQRGGVQ